MATLRELKGRIGSVASSEKITGAMKMISSAKMHKAEAALRRLEPFRSQVRTVIGNLLSSDAAFTSPLVTERTQINNALVIVWGSDDGLCGAYNANICKQLAVTLADLRDSIGPAAAVTVMTVGKKMYKAAAHLADNKTSVIVAPDDINSKSDGPAVVNFAQKVRNQFADGAYDRVDVLYMNYISAGRQRSKTLQYLPVLSESLHEQATPSGRPCLFEPDPATIFNAVIPLFLMAQMQDFFTQNQASEQAARVMAMQSANDNAKTLLEQLQLEYNKLRQQSITSELLDIVGGQVRD